MVKPDQFLPLFPLQTVLFPGGLLALKIFEARYLDMIAHCLRSQEPFGVVCLMSGREAGPSGQEVQFENIGTLAQIDQADAPQPGILHLSCKGTQRFRLVSVPEQAPNGLWTAKVNTLASDPPIAPTEPLRRTAAAWAQAASMLKAQGVTVASEPWQLGDAGWVANRWGELLPLELRQRQQLLEMVDPLARLSRVNELMQEAGFPTAGEWAPEDPGSASPRH